MILMWKLYLNAIIQKYCLKIYQATSYVSLIGCWMTHKTRMWISREWTQTPKRHFENIFSFSLSKWMYLEKIGFPGCDKSIIYDYKRCCCYKVLRLTTIFYKIGLLCRKVYLSCPYVPCTKKFKRRYIADDFVYTCLNLTVRFSVLHAHHYYISNHLTTRIFNPFTLEGAFEHFQFKRWNNSLWIFRQVRSELAQCPSLTHPCAMTQHGKATHIVYSVLRLAYQFMGNADKYGHLKIALTIDSNQFCWQKRA